MSSRKYPSGSEKRKKSRKYPSGSEKRKKRKQVDAFIVTQRGAPDKFFELIQALPLQEIRMSWLWL